MRTTLLTRIWQPRYLKPAILIGITIIAYIAAINRMQAMPWVIASLLLATLLIGYSFPHWLIRHLTVTRSGPTRAKEGDAICFEVEVGNKGWLPRFMVEAVDHLPFVGAADNDNPVSEKVLGVVAHIAGGANRRFEVSLQCEKRGLYQLGPTGLATSFPLGLAEARHMKNGGIQSLTIYPDIFPIVSLPLLGTPSEINRGSFLLPQGVGSAEFCGLREYRRGDSPRHIHWPTTARLNELMVKEFEPLASASLYLALDYSKLANTGKGKHSCFEYSVRIAASIARYACNNNMPICMTGDSANRFQIGLGTGDNHFRDLLDMFAIAEASSTAQYSSMLQSVAMNCLHAKTVFIFLSEPEANVAETLQAVALLRARGAHIFAITFDRDTFLDKPAQPHSPWTGLFDIGISFMTIRKGDDLTRLFNP